MLTIAVDRDCAAGGALLALLLFGILLLLLLTFLTFSSSSQAVLVKYAMAEHKQRLETTTGIKITTAVCAGLSVDVSTQVTLVFFVNTGRLKL